MTDGQRFEQDVHQRMLLLSCGIATLVACGSAVRNLLLGLWLFAAVYGALVLVAAAAWLVARRRGDAGLGMVLLLWPLFVVASVMMLLRGGLGGSTVWWLTLLPVAALHGGATRSGVAMSVLLLAELLLAWFYGDRLPLLFVHDGVGQDTRRLVAIVGSAATMLAINALSVRWRAQAQRAAEAARLTANDAMRVKSRFLANMSHEIRTPLNGIVGAAELLRGSRLDEGQRQVLGVLRRSTSALMSLVNDVLDFSKLEAGRMTVEHGVFDLHDVVHDAAEVFGAQAEAKNVELSAHCTPDLPRHAVGDAARLRQILHNLVGNAVKFTETGEVHVVAAPETGPAQAGGSSAWLRISVRDTGIGMTELQRQNLFEAFAQADPSTTRRFGGSGLGLAICRELAGLMGGAIEVVTLPGKGSTFMLLLPLQLPDPDRAPEPPPHEPLAGHPLAGVSVWLVSPTRSLRDDLDEVITRAGAACRPQSELPDAPTLAEARRQGAALLLCDDRSLALAGVGRDAWAAQLAATGLRGVLLVGLSVSTRSLPRELLPLYKPATPARLVDVLQRALQPPPTESATMELYPPALAGPDPEQAAPVVLLVEDNAVNQMVAQAMLERLGLTVVLAATGTQALQLFQHPPRGRPYAMVLMDCHMPELDGFACTRLMRECEARLALPRTPVVAMTASSEAEAGEDCRAAGMDGFLAKPVLFDQLADVVRHWAMRAAALPSS